MPDAQWLLTEHFWKGEEGRPWWVRAGSGVPPESAAAVAAQGGQMASPGDYISLLPPTPRGILPI